MKLNARWITESQTEYCLICRQSKGGRFLIVDLPNQTYAAFCEECLGKVAELTTLAREALSFNKAFGGVVPDEHGDQEASEG